MSWSLNLTGTRKAVKKAVMADTQDIPMGLRVAIVEICDEKSSPATIQVRGNGHRKNMDGDYRGSFTLSVEPLDVLAE